MGSFLLVSLRTEGNGGVAHVLLELGVGDATLFAFGAGSGEFGIAHLFFLFGIAWVHGDCLLCFLGRRILRLMAIKRIASSGAAKRTACNSPIITFPAVGAAGYPL